MLTNRNVYYCYRCNSYYDGLGYCHIFSIGNDFSGDKVVCIEPSRTEKMGSRDFYDVYPHWPVVGKVYVIKGFNTSGPTLQGICQTLELVGYSCKRADTGLECGFAAYRFRLLDEMKEDRRKLNEEVSIYSGI